MNNDDKKTLGPFEEDWHKSGEITNKLAGGIFVVALAVVIFVFLA